MIDYFLPSKKKQSIIMTKSLFGEMWLNIASECHCNVNEFSFTVETCDQFMYRVPGVYLHAVITAGNYYYIASCNLQIMEDGYEFNTVPTVYDAHVLDRISKCYWFMLTTCYLLYCQLSIN